MGKALLSHPLSPLPKFNSNSLSHHDLEIQPQIPKFHPKIPSQASLGASPLSQRCAPALQTPFVETTGTWRGLQGDFWENKDPCQPLPWSSGIPGLGKHNNSWIFIHLYFPQGQDQTFLMEVKAQNTDPNLLEQLWPRAKVPDRLSG